MTAAMAFDNPFTRHPKEVGESYSKHCGAALLIGLKMIGGGLACLVHGFLPFLFQQTGSETVRELHGAVRRRIDPPNWERHPII